MITLAALSSLDDAYLLRSMLEASEIPAFIPDENTSLNWGYINALGGVRVQVPEEFAEKARFVLEQFNDKSRRVTILPPSGSPEETDYTGQDQAGKKTEAAARPTSSPGGGAVLVLLAFAVVGVFLFLVECGRIQQTYFLAAQDACEKGDYDLAIADDSRSIQFGLRSEPVYLNRGLAYLRKGNYDRALADFTQALAFDPKDELIYLNRGFAYDNQGEYNQAITDDSQAIQLNPNDEYAYCNRGKAYCDKGEEDAALADFNQAILLDPTDTQAWFNRADVYQGRGDDDKAIADFTRVIQIDPKGPKAADAYSNRALSHETKGEYDKALQDCRQAIVIDPNHKYAYSTLAWLLATSPQANMRDGRKAVEAATRGCELTEWKSPDALDTLAAAYAETGDFINAVKWERQYLATTGLSSSDVAAGKSRLALYETHKPYREQHR